MKSKSTLKRPISNLARLDAIKPEEIDLSEVPELTPEMFAKGIVRRGGLKAKRPKPLITLRIDADVLDWFRSRGRGYQTEMNALLRAYMEAHRSS